MVGVGYLDGDRWLDGALFWQWLEPKLPPGFTGRHSNLTRRAYAWMNEGSRCDLYAVDPVLADLDIHPTEIPDHIWALDQTRQRGRRGK